MHLIQRILADGVATLLAEAVQLDSLSAETANGLLPPSPERIATLLNRVAKESPSDLAMLISLLLMRFPIYASAISVLQAGAEGVAMQLALDQAADRVLR